MSEERPLDEYELLDGGANEGEFSEYRVATNHKNLMLVATGALLLSVLRYTFGDFFPHITGLTLAQNQIVSIVVMAASGFSFYFMINYFRNYQLNAIVQVTWLMFIADMGADLFYLAGTFNIILPYYLNTVIGLLSIVSIIVWIVKILRLNVKNYSAMKSLRYSAITLIFSAVFGGIISAGFMFLLPPEYYQYMGLSNFPLIFYYIFILKFTLELKAKETEFHV